MGCAKYAIFVSVVLSMPSGATCWEEASRMYGIPTDVLKAVAKTESSFNTNAVGRNINGTMDTGLMQINSGWLPTLAGYGITRASLKDGCTNLKIGAWILSNNARQFGWNWEAVGAYNVGCAKLSRAECKRRRNRYAWKIHRALQEIRRMERPLIVNGKPVLEIHGRAPASRGIMVVHLGQAGSTGNGGSH
jgi:soluble lytic murein transglycosylase-like protein